MNDIASSSRVSWTGIGALCSLAGVTPRALRFYEAEGLIEARRDRSNIRCYDPMARRAVMLISRLRRAGLSLNDVRLVLARYEAGEPWVELVRIQASTRLATLKSERKALLDLLTELGLDADPSAGAFELKPGRSNLLGNKQK